MPVHTEVYGEEDALPIIMVHGAGGSSATWFMQLRGLSDSLQPIAIDLNGHGRTPDRGEEDILRSYLDDIDSIVSNYDRPILMGHSMGGALTQLYALEKSENLRGIVLVGTGARLKVMPIIIDMLENDFDSYVRAAGEYMFHEETSTKIVEASQEEIKKCPAHIISRDFQACNNFDIMKKVQNISLPSLIIVGDTDLMTPIKYSTFLKDKMEGSHLQVIEKAGHSVMLEQFKTFNQIVSEWCMTLN
ncbi:MAG: alpha/beta hydrolase [Candidatus Thorarchaeota archaeon]